MSGSSQRGDAFIQAEPIPVPEAIAAGTTTLSWSTGSEASGWVYVTDGTGEEHLFARMAAGRQEAHWIAAGVVYRFTLYADEDRTQTLASVDVEMEREEPAQATMLPSPSSAKAQPSIRADPNPVPARVGMGPTTVSWSTGDGSPGCVSVAEKGEEDRHFATGSEGFQIAPWISPETNYTFALFADQERSQLLATVDVTMEQRKRPQSEELSAERSESERPYIQAEPNPVPGTDGLGTTTISWSTGDDSPGWVFVQDADGEEHLFANTADGAQVAPWISARATHRFTLYGDAQRSRPLASISVGMERGPWQPLIGGRPTRHWQPAGGGDGPHGVNGRAPTALFQISIRANNVVTERVEGAPHLARHLRGGSQVLPIDGGHLCLGHEAIAFSDHGRAYLHRWLWFDHKWRMQRISSPFVFQSPDIEFAGGLAQRDDDLVISYGIRDREAWVATIDTAEVLSLLAEPFDARAVVSAMRANAARRFVPRNTAEPLSSLAESETVQVPAQEPATGAHATEWWQPTFQTTVDAYDRGDLSQGLDACERLLSIGGLPPGIQAQTRRNAVFYAPSLAEIAPSFSTRPVEFPVPENWTRFNPSIAADPDGNLRMIVRSSNYEFSPDMRYTIHDEKQVIRTANFLLDLDAGLNVESVRAIDDRAFRVEPPPFRITGFEDCRLVYRGGSWWMSATVWDHTGGGKCQMALLRLEDAAAIEMHLLSDGVTRQEKNWMPVQPSDGNELFFIYSCFPTVLLKFDEHSGQSTEWRDRP